MLTPVSNVKMAPSSKSDIDADRETDGQTDYCNPSLMHAEGQLALLLFTIFIPDTINQNTFRSSIIPSSYNCLLHPPLSSYDW